MSSQFPDLKLLNPKKIDTVEQVDLVERFGVIIIFYLTIIGMTLSYDTPNLFCLSIVLMKFLRFHDTFTLITLRISSPVTLGLFSFSTDPSGTLTDRFRL